MSSRRRFFTSFLIAPLAATAAISAEPERQSRIPETFEIDIRIRDEHDYSMDEHRDGHTVHLDIWDSTARENYTGPVTWKAMAALELDAEIYAQGTAYAKNCIVTIVVPKWKGRP